MIDLEQLLGRFIAEFGTLLKVDRSLLLHRHYSKEEIEALIENGTLHPTTPYDKDGAFANEVSYLIRL